MGRIIPLSLSLGWDLAHAYLAMASPPASPSSATTTTTSSSSSSSASLVPLPDAAADPVDRRAALEVELFAQSTRALTLARETRPKNTNKAYNPKQRE